MPKTHDIVAVVGSYEKDGKEKPKFKNCGALIEKSGKLYIKLDALPIHESEAWNGWFQCFEPRQPHQQAAQSSARQEARQAAGLPNEGFDDDIPF